MKGTGTDSTVRLLLQQMKYVITYEEAMDISKKGEKQEIKQITDENIEKPQFYMHPMQI